MYIRAEVVPAYILRIRSQTLYDYTAMLDALKGFEINLNVIKGGEQGVAHCYEQGKCRQNEALSMYCETRINDLYSLAWG
jgi:hypothetical protein